MSIELESVERINNLKQGIEATTGETYNDLTEGIQALKDGYKQGGEIGKPYIDTSKITDFRYFYSDNVRFETLDRIDTSNAISFRYMFRNCDQLKSIPSLNLDSATDLCGMYYGCSGLENVPILKFKKAMNFMSMFEDCSGLKTIEGITTDFTGDFSESNQTARYMFSGCTNLTTIKNLSLGLIKSMSEMFFSCSALIELPTIDISSVRSFGSAFSRCASLKKVSFTKANSDFSSNTFFGCTALQDITIGEGWAVNIYLHYSNELTVESLHGMIENLADLTGLTAKTFQIGATNLAKIDEEHINMLKAKNWNYS